MRIKFLQINIYKGKFLEELVNYIARLDPDLVAMQEVSAGQVSLYEDKGANIFEVLKERTGYRGVFHSDVSIIDEPAALFGNAVFSKWPITGLNVCVLNTFRPVTASEFNDPLIWSKLPRHMLDAQIDVDGRKIHAISLHGRRVAPPIDNLESTRQARAMADYLKSLGDEPFVVGGDFNMPPESEVIKIVSGVSNNLMADSGVSQTLNPKVHELGEKGYLVDYIFTSKHFKKISLDVPQVTISDHLPVAAELEL